MYPNCTLKCILGNYIDLTNFHSVWSKVGSDIRRVLSMILFWEFFKLHFPGFIVGQIFKKLFLGLSILKIVAAIEAKNEIKP